MSVVAVDVGGTFTDVACLGPAGRLDISKVATRPQDISAGVLAGLEAVGAPIPELARIIHGTTVATNALLERKGAKLGMLTTAGFRDVLAIGRTQRRVQYDPSFRTPPPLVAPELTLEVRERTAADGTVLLAPAAEEIRALTSALVERGVEAVAVCFLWSVANGTNELSVKAQIRGEFPDLPVFCSAEVLAEIREYERFSTTVMTAYVAPRVERYVNELDRRLRRRSFRGTLRVMQSNGGVLSPQLVGLRAASTIVSGPAGGVIEARRIGASLQEPNLITIDVGGTSTDVCLIAAGDVLTTRERSIDGYPIRVPMVDIHTVGAGGGSIARIDGTGALRVGPASAGSIPGPASYGRGGTQPTVTDAYVVAGKIAEDSLLGGAMRVFGEQAKQAIIRDIADPLGVSVEYAADGIARVSEEHVNQAIRVVSVERGFDPREFLLVAFGGAGPIQAAAIAESLSINRVLIPPYPGVTSALGLLAADVLHDFVRTRLIGFDEIDPRVLTDWFVPLEEAGAEALIAEQIAAASHTLLRSVEMRYRGQASEIEVPLPGGRELDTRDLARAAARFHTLHERARGITLPDSPLEVVTLRLRAVGRLAAADWSTPSGMARRRGAPVTRVVRHAGEVFRADVHSRTDLAPEDQVSGPMVLESRDATVFIPPGWVGRVDTAGNLMLTRGGPNV